MNTKEIVMVTGANGMLGIHICIELLNKGYMVKAFCIPESDISYLKPLNLVIEYGNVLNEKEVSKAMEGCHYLIHAAALTNIWPRRNEKVNEVNIKGTQILMTAAEQHKIKRMVHIGSASSFGWKIQGPPANEFSPYTGWKYRMDYLDSKFTAQQILLENYARKGFPVVIINPTFMIGAYDSGPSSGQMLIGLYKNKIPGYSSGGKNFVCTADVAVAVVNALTMGSVGNCYIAGNENLSFKEFFIKASQIMGRPFTLKKIPPPVILSTGFVLSLASRITNKKPTVSFGMAKLANEQQRFSSNRAIRELEIPQTPIEEGIRACLTWFEENNYLK
jgi:dihydroflavonol-4-reductase